MNINNTTKHIYKNNVDMKPFYDDSDPRLLFLQKFSNWLDIWENDNRFTHKLSKETFFSLKFTARSLVSLIKYLLKTLEFTYLLTAKFQTDCLEARFGLYRQSSGGNYHVTLQQIIETEKKIRARNFIILNGKKFMISNTTLELEEMNIYFPNIQITDGNLSQDEIDSLIYIGGYLVRKAEIEDCCKDLYTSIYTENESNYLADIDRGKLIYQSEYFC